MRIKILFDNDVIVDTEVKNAELSQARDLAYIYKSSDFKKSHEHKPYEIVPSARARFCIDYEVNEMPNSEFYIMSCDSSPSKAGR